MSEFLTLFKYELKKQFPAFFKRDKKHLAGFLFSSIFTLVIIGLCVFLMSIITKNYVLVKVDKVLDSSTRAYELLNLYYVFILIAMIFICLEKMRKSFVDKTDRKIFLRLPIKQQTLFIAKLIVLLISTYLIALLFIIPTNIIVYLAVKPSWVFWLKTFVVFLLLPIVVLLFASLFIVPYIKLIDFLKNKYIFMFILLTVIFIATFFLYSMILGIIQNYLETGLIRFLFNDDFIYAMDLLLLITYPANCFAGITMGKNLLISYLVVVLCVILSCVVVYYITKKLYNITLYKNESAIVYKKVSKVKEHSVFATLIKKEFISVFREPKHMFSYFVIATAMPVMVYCCYTLFESLILNMIGVRFSFELALLVILVFSVLTNTFCSTNISREGKTLLKQKTMPIQVEKLLGAKIVFCSMVSISAVVLSSLILIIVTSLNILSGLLCMFVGIMFSLSQIFIATKIDLKNVKIISSSVEVEKQENRTVTKVVTLGIVLSLIVGIGDILLGMLSKGLFEMSFPICFVYLIPIFISAVYLILAIVYYRKNLQQALERVNK
ncbi:MAG: hypothetical protein IJ008_01565 [Clostridia bacterium]|nr:hypothetical protein [Clostridia bacterium]